MIESTKYLKDGTANVLQLMKTTFGDYFKFYFNGEPSNIPEYSLPCLIVSETSGTIEADATGTDIIAEEIVIIIVLNKKDFIGGEDDTDLSELEIRRLVKGQDSTTSYPYQYVPESVMYALRRNITMTDLVVHNTIQTEFGPGVRVSTNGSEMATQEAYITVSLERLALVPDRL